MQIEGKTVLVTGASSGAGAAIAKAMAKAGAAEILLLARNEEALKKVASEITAKGAAARVFPVDLSNSEHTLDTARRIMSDVGVPDILVNNAGSGQWKFLEETSPAEVQAMMALPYFAAAWLTSAFLPRCGSGGAGTSSTSARSPRTSCGRALPPIRQRAGRCADSPKLCAPIFTAAASA